MLAETASIKLAKDGLIITDDGTQGDRACRNLWVRPEKLFFARNGVDKRRWLRYGATRTPTRSVRAGAQRHVIS